MNRLCCFYSEHNEVAAPRRTRTGTLTSSGTPTDKLWYHGNISHARAERMIPAVCSNGLYLVYDSPTSKRDFILLVKLDDEVHRFDIVKRRSDQYVLGSDTLEIRAHESVRKLIKYHRGLTGKPINLKDGRHVVLGDYVCKDN